MARGRKHKLVIKGGAVGGKKHKGGRKRRGRKGGRRKR